MQGMYHEITVHYSYKWHVTASIVHVAVWPLPFNFAMTYFSFMTAVEEEKSLKLDFGML